MLTLAVWPAPSAWAQSPGLRDSRSLFPQPGSTVLPGLRRQFDPQSDADFGDEETDTREERRRRRREEALGGLQVNSLESSQTRNTQRGRENAERSDDGQDARLDERDRLQEERDAPGDEDDSLRRLDPDRLADSPDTDAQEVEEGIDDRGAGPYDPVGVRMGSFLLFPEIAIERLYSDNALLSSTDSQPDQATAVATGLGFRSNWSRHLLEGSVSAVKSFYSEFPEFLDDDQFSSNLHGRLDVTRRTNVDIRAGYSLDQEDVDSPDAPAGAIERTPIRSASGSLQLSRRFNRLTASLRGALSNADYDDVLLRNGGIANNDDRDFTERELTGRLSYAFRPGVDGFVEGSGNERDFASVFDDNGIRNGSAGYEVLAGISLEFGGKLTGEIAAGFARQTPEERSLEDISGLILNGNLEWRPTQLTTVRFEAESEIEETTQTNSAGSIVRTAELSLEHAFRRNIIAGVSLGYELEEFSGSGEEEKAYSIGLSGEYLLSREVALVTSYEFTKDTDSVPDNDYIENEFRVGVRLRR